MHLFLSYLLVFLQISPTNAESNTTENTNANASTPSIAVTSKDVGLTTSETTQNYSTVTPKQHETTGTTVNGSEIHTSTYSTSYKTTINITSGSTTKSGNLTTTPHGEANKTTAHLLTSSPPDNVTSGIINATTQKLTTNTVTAFNGTSTSKSTSNYTSHMETTTVNSVTSSGLPSTTSVSSSSGSSFDTASFLGGIVLALGLCVIAVFGYRCYKNRKSSTPPYRIVDE